MLCAIEQTQSGRAAHGFDRRYHIDCEILMVELLTATYILQCRKSNASMRKAGDKRRKESCELANIARADTMSKIMSSFGVDRQTRKQQNKNLELPSGVQSWKVAVTGLEVHAHRATTKLLEDQIIKRVYYV